MSINTVGRKERPIHSDQQRRKRIPRASGALCRFLPARPLAKKTSRIRTRNRSRAPSRRLHRWLLWSGLAAFLIVAAVVLIYGFWASTFDIHDVRTMRERSTVFDMDGKVYSRLQGENRVTVPLAEVSPFFVKALLAREDARFYSHRGVDPIGIGRAVLRNVTSGSARQGASTLTQQLARNSFVLGGKNMHRKLLEAFVAARIEQHYSKDEILEHYMNRIYFGSGVYGIETASQAYFSKPAKNLTLGESAMIAGIIRAPTYFSPFRNLKGALKERDTVLDRMVKLERIKPAEAKVAKAAPIALAKRHQLGTQENYAMDMVQRELDLLLTDDQQAQGGFKIYTTVDPELQKAAQLAVDAQLRKIEARPGYEHAKRADFSEEARKEELPTPYLQGALVAIDNRSGGIRALVGGRDYAESKLNRAVQSERPVGSTFKPIVYAAAFAHGLLPGTNIDDGRIERGEIRGAGDWTPGNSDGTFKGPMRAEEGLVLSRNTMSVRVGERVGLEEVTRVAKALGLPEIPQQPAVYLGAFEAKLTDVTAAYSVFANGGIRRQSYVIERIDDASGEVVYRAAHVQAPVLDAGVSWEITNALRQVLERGTAASAKSLGFTKPAAGKTGTTDEYRDAWFVGYTSTLTCGVWVGLDRPEKIMARGYGSALALPIWVDVMNDAPASRYPSKPFAPPVNLQRTYVCSASGLLATGGCEKAGTAYNADLPPSCAPDKPCGQHRGSILTDRDRKDDGERRSVPQSIFRSFKKFFGGG
jgi:penicillin-binding protein 1A